MIQNKSQNMAQNSQNTVKDYRFNVLERMYKFNPKYKSDLIISIASKTKNSIPSVKRLIYRKKESTENINYEILKAFAEHFKVNVEALENFTN